MLFGHVVDELLNQNGLADSSTPEQTRLAPLGVRFQEIDDFDAGLENLDFRRLLIKWRRLAMDGPALLGIDGSQVVHRLAKHVQNAAQRFLTDGDRNRFVQVGRFHPAHHPVSRFHGDAAHLILADVIGHLDDDVDRHLPQLEVVGDAHGVVDRRKMSFLKLDIDRGADDLDHSSNFLFAFSHARLPY